MARRIFIHFFTGILLLLGGTQLSGQAFDYSLIACDSLNTIIQQIFENDSFEKPDYKKRAPRLYEVMLDKQCAALPDAMNLLGVIYFNQKEAVAAKNILLRADSMLRHAAPESHAYVRNQLWLGLVDLQEGRFESAKLYFDKSVRLSKAIGFRKGLFQAYLNLGTGYLNFGDLEAAEIALQQAIDLYNDSNYPLWIGYVYLNLSRIATDRAQYEKAFELNEWANRYWLEHDYYKGLYYTNLHFAAILGRQERAKERVPYLKNALAFAEKDLTLTPHTTYVSLAYHYFLDEKDNEQAKYYFEKALESGEVARDDGLVDIASLLIDIYVAEQDIESIKRINALMVNIFKSKAELARIEALKWQTKEETLEKQLIENKALRETQLQNQLAIQRRNLLLYFLIAFLLVIAIVAFLQFRSARLRNQLLLKIKSQHEEVQRINEALTEQKIKIEQQNETILKTQDQLILQEKLAALGQLIAGIAHEIKNPLNFVKNFGEDSIELLAELGDALRMQQANIPPDQFAAISTLLDDLTQNADDIHASGVRADRIVNNMMEHTRGHQGEKGRQYIDINEQLDQSLNLAYHSFKASHADFKVQFQKEYGPELPEVEAVLGSISRVFINIINNACFALYQKQQQQGDFQAVLKLKTRNEDKTVWITIEDNGPGIPAAIRKDIFTPFYTTKPAGAGNAGLGLSICYDIVVQEHNGKIEVESEPEAFTRFLIQLPV